eukprot:TRINITY_DN30442_c0_g1_i1.p1 TRINITY_DN30442_c0_g1~~TRINITY_DN30442_c0_g1_i1.p1  ORF type:complete len:546 (+),score=97.07 TRINITY_DN30442_c0_g1_i1:31-1638(+)
MAGSRQLLTSAAAVPGGRSPCSYGIWSEPAAGGKLPRAGAQLSSLARERAGDFGEGGGGFSKRRLLRVARWLETSDDTDPAQLLVWLFEDFSTRKLRPRVLMGWLLLQLLSLLLQLHLLIEVSRHLTEYEATLALNCGPEHLRYGICLGPFWNLSAYSTLAISSDGGAEFSFKTTSRPPTFLLGVEPQAPLADASWEASVWSSFGRCARDATKSIEAQLMNDLRVAMHIGRDARQAGCGTLPASGVGAGYTVLTAPMSSWLGEDLWTLRLRLSPAPQNGAIAWVHVHVVDAAAEHLDQINAQRQCFFGHSWKNFSERHNGAHHGILTSTRHAIMFFLCISGALTAWTFHRFYYYVSVDKLLRRVIFVKLLLQDLPLQVCIGAYFYAWYATNGLRCQMCLFHPEHCADEHPLNLYNLLLCACTALSSSTNQLLLQDRPASADLCDRFVVWLSRAFLFSVSVLPLSVALFFSVFWFNYGGMPPLLFTLIIAAFPMVAGLLIVCCGPCMLLLLKTDTGNELIDRVDDWIVAWSERLGI